MIKELESLGRLLDKITEEHQNLPNEFTAGKVEGVRAAYALLAGLITNEPTEAEEDIPFSTPNGPMTKYGVPNDGVPERLAGIEDLVQLRTLGESQEDSEELQELQEIKGVIQDIYNLMQAQANNHSEDAQKLFTAQQESQILDDVANEAKSAGLDVAEGESALDEMVRLSQEAGLYDEDFDPKDFKRGMELDEEERKNPLKNVDRNFGQRRLGNTESTGTLRYTPEQVRAAKEAIAENEEKHQEFQLSEFIRKEQEQKALDKKAEERIAELRQQTSPAPFSLERAVQIEEEQTGRKRLPGFEVDPADVGNSAYEETFDVTTGEKGRQRRIGSKFNPDDDTVKKSVEDWNKLGSNPNARVYTAQNNDELQDLGPGEV